MSYPIKVWTGSQWEEIGLSGGALAITAPPDISASGAVGSTTVLSRADHTHGFDPNEFDLLDNATASATYLTRSNADSIYLPLSGSVNWSNINNKPDPSITLIGDVSGSTTLTDLNSASIIVTVEKDFSLTFTGDIAGSGTVNNLASASIALTISANSVALGTDTTGNYVQDITASAYVLKAGTASEGQTAILSVDATPQNTANKVVARDSSGNFSANIITASVTGNAGTATTLATARKISLGGDLSGSATFNGSSDITINAAIGANSVALGTDTTGNYVAGLTAGNGISITGTAGEGWSPTVSINSSTASVLFANINNTPTTLSGYGITDALAESTASAIYLRQDTANVTYLPISASSNYLFESTASAIYLNKTEIPVTLGIACSDETTDLTTASPVVTFRMPHAMTLTDVRASVNTAPAGSSIIVDINESGTSVLSTKLSIDAGESTSTTASVSAVISDSALADDAQITIDIDQIGSSTAGAGLKVWLIGTRE